ncbi:MAG: hypothetical protein RSB94_07280 [Erysipelotrichaceae bacterium]
MITSQVVGNGDKEVKYPLLARLKANKEVIVLFSRAGCGVIVAHEDKLYVGSYEEDWNDISNWEILPNDFKVILQNTDV